MRLKNIILIFVFAIIMVSAFSGCANKNTASNFEQFQAEGKKDEAVKVLENITDGNEKSQSIEFLNNQIDQAYNDFIDEKIDYEKATSLVNDTIAYNVVNDKANEILKKVVSLNNSREAFNKAKKLEESKDYGEASVEYGKVIQKDKNYATATSKIKEMEQKLVDSQEVVISNIKLTKDLIDDNEATMVLTNKTADKVVKVVYLSILAYDKDGFPVKLNFGYDKIYNAKAEENMQPGKSTVELTWTTYADQSTREYRACVKAVEYYDGTTWNNPLYQSWYNEFYDKPIQKQ